MLAREAACVRWGRRALVVCAAVAAGMLCSCVSPRAELSRTTPYAVVLTQRSGRSELAVIDLERMQEVRRIGLRSLCLSIDGDARTGLVVTAQCGGVGPDADDACGVVDPRISGRVRYVGLTAPNPMSVGVSGNLAVVTHGFEQTAGVVVSRFDPGARRRPRAFHVGQGAGRPERAGDRVVLPVRKTAAGRPAELRTLGAAHATQVVTLAADPSLVVMSEESTLAGPAVVTRERPNALGWALRLPTPQGRPERVIPLIGVEKGIFEGCAVGRFVALADADGLDPRHPGNGIVVLDGNSGKVLRRVRVRGTPSALRPWNGRLVVADGIAGEVLVIDPATGRVLERVAVAGLTSGTSDLVILQGTH